MARCDVVVLSSAGLVLAAISWATGQLEVYDVQLYTKALTTIQVHHLARGQSCNAFVPSVGPQP